MALISEHFDVTKENKTRSNLKNTREETAVNDDGRKNSDNSLQNELDLLRKFDLDWKYGPATGLTRLERWERALKHSLDPPQEVKELLMRHKEDVAYTRCVWNEHKILS